MPPPAFRAWEESGAKSDWSALRMAYAASWAGRRATQADTGTPNSRSICAATLSEGCFDPLINSWT